MDLTVTNISTKTITVIFTAPGDDLDDADGKAAEYIVKFSSTAGNLTGNSFDSEEFNVQIKPENLIESTLDPVDGGSSKKFKIKAEVFASNKKYILAMKARDDADNFSPVSNKVQIFIQKSAHLQITTSTTTTTTTTTTATTTTTTKTTEKPITTTTTTEPSGAEVMLINLFLMCISMMSFFIW